MQPYLAHLEAVLTPARLRHSLGVMQVMTALAEVYGLDREQAGLTGLLHDAAKDLTPDQQAEMARAAGFVPANEAERDYNIYGHGPVGAYYVRAVMGVTDPLLLDAVAAHTFMPIPGGEARFHAPLCWCLRFADLLEPNRDWDEKARAFRDGMPALREAAFAGRLEQAAQLHGRMVIAFHRDNDMVLHPNYPRVLAQLEAGLQIQR